MTPQDAVLRALLEIEVLSPVHVGTGETISRLSFLERDDVVCVLDERKLVEAAGRSHAATDAFERVCLDNLSLNAFLTGQHLQLDPLVRYRLPKMGTRVGRDVLPCVKTPAIPPRPYLPGSSLKGALRAAFLRAHLLSSAEIAAQGEREIKSMFPVGNSKQADDALESWLFGKDEHHDWMRLIELTDTRPARADCLRVAEVRTLSLNLTGGLQPKSFTLSPEVLAPRAVLRGALVINQYLTWKAAEPELGFSKGSPFIENFAVLCNQVAAEQIGQEMAFYRASHQADLVDWYADLDKRLSGLGPYECLLRLGWGAGYDDKTVSDVFAEDTFDEIRDTYKLPVGRPGRTGAPLPKAQSPKSRKLAVERNDAGHEKLWPLGWVRLKAALTQ